MAQDLLDFIKSIDIKSQTRENHISTCVNKYEKVTDGNYKSLCLIALEQYHILFSNENLSGFYIVDWRINFNSLRLFIENGLNKDSISLNEMQFIKNYDTSAKVLYDRLGIEY